MISCFCSRGALHPALGLGLVMASTAALNSSISDHAHHAAIQLMLSGNLTISTSMPVFLQAVERPFTPYLLFRFTYLAQRVVKGVGRA